jgi:hypothetical protein
MVAKSDPVNVQYETLAKNLLKGELKRRGITYAQLKKKLASIRVTENGPNLKIENSQSNFAAVFVSPCLSAVGASLPHSSE